MTNKGQIVEIPVTSAIYSEVIEHFNSKQDELIDQLRKRDYGLFDGFLVGEHLGVGHFMLGQRKGINVGGKEAPLYVIGINKTTNQLFVGEGEDHPGLWTTVIGFNENQIQPALTFSNDQLENGMPVQVKSSLSETEWPATLYKFNTNAFLEFDQAVSIAIQNQPLEIKADNNLTSILNNK